MNIGDQLNTIVDAIVADIKSKVDANIAQSIQAEIAEAVQNYDFDTVLTDLAEPKIANLIANYPVPVNEITKQIGAMGANVVSNFETTITQKVLEAAQTHLANIDVTPIIESSLRKYLQSAEFPKNSISSQAVNFTEHKLSGDYVEGGIIKNFASLGIEDQATTCQITVTDKAVIIEPPILTRGVQVKGNAKIEETLIVNKLNVNEFAGNATVQLADDIMQHTLATVAEKGLVAPKLVFKDRVLIDEESLAVSIVNSNLRKVGVLQELQTRGEALLDNTLYISNKRVGINTLEPGYALSVWDDDVEVAVSKQSQNRAFIGTHRPINVTLGANGKNNISLEADGSVTINDLRLGALPLSTASNTPNWSGRAGEIVFNDSPNIGQPIGWVCLGEHRWGKFGIIQD